MKTNIGLLLTKRAHLNPDREAYVESDGSRRCTFKEVERAIQPPRQCTQSKRAAKGGSCWPVADELG